MSGDELPHFVVVDSFFPRCIFLFCHSKNNPAILTLLSLLNSLLNGVLFLTDDIATLAKARNDIRGAILFFLAFVGALRRTQIPTHSI